MNNEEYAKKIARLREIEQSVRKPEFSLDKIDELIEETRKIVEDCSAYTRTLLEKVEKLGKQADDLEI